MYARPIQLLDFCPDADDRTPGMIKDMDGFVGTVAGLRTVPSFVPVASLPLPSLGSYTATMPSGDQFTVAGTQDHLYKLMGTSWIPFDSGQTFNTGSRWRFTTFGVDVLAVNGSDPPQVSSNELPFVPLATHKPNPSYADPPISSIVETANPGVFLILPRSDQYYFSGISDAIWTVGTPAAIATETVTARLQATQGPITAFHRIRGGVVAYKTNSMYFGQFTGPPFFWQFTAISENVGTLTNEMVINAADVHLFLANDDFYMFDGSTLQRIPNQVKGWFFSHVNPAYLDRTLGGWDAPNSLAIWYFSSLEADPPGALDQMLMWNMRTGKWTKARPRTSDGVPFNVQDVVQPNSVIDNSLTYRTFGELFDRYSDIPDITYANDLFGGPFNEVPGVFNGGNGLMLRNGPSVGGTLLSGEIGDGFSYFQISRLRPIFEQWPADNAGHIQTYRRRIFGFPIPDTNPFRLPFLGQQAWLTKRDGCFNFIVTARSHQWRMSFSALTEITSWSLDMTEVGTE